MHILYIEDNPFDADLTRRELRRLSPNIQLDVVDTLAGAFEKLAADALRYAAVLLDLRLPDGDGLTLLNHIRQANLPLVVIILTGGGDEETAVSALKAGADDYVIKHANYLAGLPATIKDAMLRFEAGQRVRNRRLRVLYAERHPQDIDLTRRHLAMHAAYIQLKVVSTAADVLAELSITHSVKDELASGRYDVLLFDYEQGPLNALDLIKQISRQGHPLLPVVLVTGEGNEEVALQALKLGASDYVVKTPGYLYRLPGVLENAFHMAELERERQALKVSEQRFRLLAETARDVIFRWLKAENRFEYVSPAILEMTGFAPEEFTADPELWRRLVHAQDVPMVERVMTGDIPSGGVVMRWQHRDGHMLWTEHEYSAVHAENGELIEIHGIARDITARHQAEEARDRTMMEKEEATRRLTESYEKTIEGWALALELREMDPQGHSLRVADLAVKTAAALGLPPEAQGDIRRGALLHDIGKLGVPDSILQKPGPLTEDEWVVMRRHPAIGYQLLYPVEFLRPAIEIPYCHRERWDGSGYPHGLKGDEIPLAARIFAVVDVWEALNSHRPYRPAWERVRVARFLREQAGIKFDPQVVSVFLGQVVGES